MTNPESPATLNLHKPLAQRCGRAVRDVWKSDRGRWPIYYSAQKENGEWATALSCTLEGFVFSAGRRLDDTDLVNSDTGAYCQGYEPMPEHLIIQANPIPPKVGAEAPSVHESQQASAPLDAEEEVYVKTAMTRLLSLIESPSYISPLSQFEKVCVKTVRAWLERKRECIWTNRLKGAYCFSSCDPTALWNPIYLKKFCFNCGGKIRVEAEAGK